MKKFHLIPILLILLLSAATAFAGGGGEEVVDVEDDLAGISFEGIENIDYSAWEIGQRGGTLVLASLSDPNSLNSVVAAETSTTDITDLTQESTWARSQLDLEYEPRLATWEISADGRTVTGTLREGLLWSDGEPITAEDLVFTMNHLYLREDIDQSVRNSLFLENPDTGLDEPVVFEVVDELTYRATLPTTYIDVLGLTGITPEPMHVWAPIIGWTPSVGLDYEYEYDEEGNVVEIKDPSVDYAAANSAFGVDVDVTTIVGAGPFTIAEYVPGELVRMTRNPNYYRTDAAGTQLPYLDEVVYRIIPDQDTQLQNLLAGQIDGLGIRGEDVSTVLESADEVGLTLWNVGPAGGTQFITFNQNPIEGEEDAGLEPPALTWNSNRTFRIAMAHLVDRQTIINNIAFGYGFPQYSFIPVQSPFFLETAEDVAYLYDPDRAAELLDSIDYIDRDGDGFREDPDGNKISMTLSTNAGNRVRERIVELFAQEAANVGIEIIANPIDFNVLVNQLVSSYDWEMILIGLTGNIGPVFGSNVYPSDGNLHMIEPLQESPRREWEARVDELYDLAVTSPTEEAAVPYYNEMQEIWIREVPWVYTFNPASISAYKSNIGNIIVHPFDAFGFKGAIEFFFIDD